ncbi:potassium channel family protein [Microlunatus parietis]|uniref:Voltage-gated potassium channel n=1 Tax=Microlunatus parietis TaxID=682979 RepID=A0A7Y9IC78_9ACTN|nr:potassium channel family protein [Microlunatus parietis]NYE73926.1 voltage-gated potassium channel [Microlunatus parietis]
MELTQGSRSSLTGRWERATEWPLMVAAVAFLVSYAVPIIRPEIGLFWVERFQWASWATWALFAVDYIARLVLAEDRKGYALKHWCDLLIIALPLLRPLRLLRLVSLLEILNRKASTGLRGRVAVYVAGGSALMAFCGALAVLDAERESTEANITTFADALWWALTTMTTVGYGDRYPTTDSGRLAAAALMIGGITLLGIVTATLASWLVEKITITEKEQTADLRAEILALNEKLDRLLVERTEQEASSWRS